MTATLLLMALLHMAPWTHSPYRACLRARAATIAAQATSAAEAHGVPTEIVMAVGALESAYGCSPHSGGSWGSPIGRDHRNIAGGADHQARDLATSFRVCGSWLHAINRYRNGRCAGGAFVGYTPAQAMRLAGRLRASVSEHE